MEMNTVTRKEGAKYAAGTYDFRSPVEMVRAIDQAMRHYFGASDWMVLRDREFPSLRPGPYPNGAD